MSKYIVLPLVLFVITSCTGIPEGIKPVKNFDVTKYQGKWFEIARLDHSFERGLEKITAQYTIKPDDNVEVINQGFSTIDNEWDKAIGNAKFVNKKDEGHLKVSFFGPFYGSYVIFYLDDDYQHAFVSGPNTNYLWLLSRKPNPPTELIDKFIQMSGDKGFDITKLIFVKHLQN
ncbi:MAG: lipocalin family protein [Colwelliaceae bacterium]|nr:lipocalin family protein [Colwelliaceae bacterium]